MRVEIQLQSDAALELHHQQAGENNNDSKTLSGASQLKNEVQQLGLTLEPVHPGQTHPLLAPYFTIEVPDSQTAAKVIEQLSKNKLVESAYIRPEQSPP
ncbi:MAG: hypothetical protein ABIN89_31210 [Chitinophagaceae bacterium]